MIETPPPVAPSSLAFPQDLPVLPLRDIVVYPFSTVSLSVSRLPSVRAVEAAMEDKQLIGLVSQKEPEIQNPALEDIHQTGTVGIVLRKLKLPDDRLRVLVQGLARTRLATLETDGRLLRGRFERVEETEAEGKDLEIEAQLRSVTSNIQRLVTLGKNIPAEVLLIASNLTDPGRLADLAASNLDLKVADGQMLLETLDPLLRLRRANELLSREIELRFMEKEITNQAREEMGRSQKEYFLRQQLKAIQRQLGEEGGWPRSAP